MPTSGSELAEQIHEIAAGWSKRATELEAMVTRLERQRVADGQEIRALSKVVTEWEPVTCGYGQCPRHIPAKAHLDMLAALAPSLDLRAKVTTETLLAWGLGYCCAAHAQLEEERPALRVVPAQTEGA